MLSYQNRLHVSIRVGLIIWGLNILVPEALPPKVGA